MQGRWGVLKVLTRNFTMYREAGYFSAYLNTKTTSTTKALDSLLAEIKGIQAGQVSPEELSTAKERDRKAETLTAREIEVLQLLAFGHTNRDIADALYISENTVKNHVRNILEKLHLHSRMEAVIYAVKEKLLDLDETSEGGPTRGMSRE